MDGTFKGMSLPQAQSTPGLNQIPKRKIGAKSRCNVVRGIRSRIEWLSSIGHWTKFKFEHLRRPYTEEDALEYVLPGVKLALPIHGGGRGRDGTPAHSPAVNWLAGSFSGSRQEPSKSEN